MANRDSDLAARIAVIKQEFLNRLHKDNLPKLRGLRQRFQGSPSDESVRDQIMRAAHDMSGSGAVFGYENVSRSGRRLEDAVRAVIKHEVEDTAERRQEILALMDELETICAATAADLKSGDKSGS